MQRELHSDGEEMQAKRRTGREVYLRVARFPGVEHALYRKCGHLRRYALIRRKFCLLKLLRVETSRCLDAWNLEVVHGLALLQHVGPQAHAP